MTSQISLIFCDGTLIKVNDVIASVCQDVINLIQEQLMELDFVLLCVDLIQEQLMELDFLLLCVVLIQEQLMELDCVLLCVDLIQEQLMELDCVLLVFVDLIQEQLMDLDCLLPLQSLLKTSSAVWRESAVTLLSALTSHTPNKP
ncbi:hypothetical protein NQZ68_033345 [Dissostichus eleginoides]|nr:hypothetical protein NQZ68_033345 [Dissostichus eleginoides]